ncbi:hypothetical protein [Pedosphaera parvula]|uniref:Uncharacterized protein n=1 Tax=Pedosphaera parvula (strain Ellin514) TaxID=320771 RepID=B9XH27_PEDPL|nr:hypothetical protein [Pedosphaera parvula]EEF60948.1 hypothetical protein Cflav_PD4117 [Pedosphaera parvula Ellin514]
METIATYSEVRFDGSRKFTLFSDKLAVNGKRTLHSEFETVIPLNTLDPNYDRLRVRNVNFGVGLWMAVIAFVTSTVLVSGFKMSFTALAPGMIATVGLAGLILCAATYRKVEFLRFKNAAGLAILDIARAGKDAPKFDSFIEALIKQIKNSRGPAQDVDAANVVDPSATGHSPKQ